MKDLAYIAGVIVSIVVACSLVLFVYFSYIEAPNNIKPQITIGSNPHTSLAGILWLRGRARK